MTQKEFGEIFGLSRGMMDSYERDVATASYATLKGISNYFNLTLEDITESTEKEIEKKYSEIINRTLPVVSETSEQQVKDLLQIIKAQSILIEKLQKRINSFSDETKIFRT